MADKPSRGLVLYGDGLARLIGPAQTNLHGFAYRASCGFLALHHPSPSENEETRIIREFAEILDSNEAYGNPDVENTREEKLPFPTVAERFMGMKAAIITDDLSLKSFGGTLGFKVFNWNDLTQNGDLASELLKLLGFQEGKMLETSTFDLIFVHIGAGVKTNGLKDIELVNKLVGDLSHVALPESDVGSRLHMSVIMSYGAMVGDDDLKLSVFDSKLENGSEFSVVFPRQSYTMKRGKPRENVRNYCPMLLAQYQSAVTRMDTVESFSYRDIFENGGNLVIPADRFLHEVAFKLWKAPKYGA
ncbi:hypothetical protein ACP275_05G138600 [Erythranthe tilingii]